MSWALELILPPELRGIRPDRCQRSIPNLANNPEITARLQNLTRRGNRQLIAIALPAITLGDTLFDTIKTKGEVQ